VLCTKEICFLSLAYLAVVGNFTLLLIVLGYSGKTSLPGAGIAQWWERSRPTNVSRVRFLPGAVRWLSWFSPCTEFSSPGLPILLPPQKKKHLQLNSNSSRMDNSQENQFFSDAALSIYNVIPNAGTDLRTEKTRSHRGFKKSAFTSRIKSVTSRFRNPSEVVSRF